MKIRKTVVIREVIHGEGGGSCTTPVTRIAGIGIIENPFAGQFVDDLSELFVFGEELGQSLMAEMLSQPIKQVVSYGKAAVAASVVTSNMVTR